jgi:two-component system sensor histidine kinase/response regulator
LINTSAVQTFKLLENLLEWAKSQQGNFSYNPETIELRELLEEECNLLSDTARRKNIELKCFSEVEISVYADRNMLRTVLRNLISNAVKFTHRNGTIEVRAFADNIKAEISVLDDGIGMTKETIKKLFRIDFNLSTRGTENEKGTGLGLFLCKEFVEKNGGTIWVESEPGKGSEFKFVLPAIVKNSL